MNYQNKFSYLILLFIFIFTINCQSAPSSKKDSLNNDISKSDTQNISIPNNSFNKETEIKKDETKIIVQNDLKNSSNMPSDTIDNSETDESNDEKIVEAEGKSVISQLSNDKVKAEEEATKQAIRNAVEQGVGTFVASQTMVEKYKLLSDRIFTKAEGFVKSYDKIGTRTEGDMFIVKIRAIVQAGKIKDELIVIGLMKQQLKNPTFMVVGVEKLGNQVLDQFIVGNMLNDFLIGKTFEVIDYEQIAENIKRDVQAAVDDMNLASALARRFKADIIITYKANVTNDGKSYNSIMKSDLYKATSNLQVKAVDASSARLVCTETVRQPGTSDGSMDSAANRALEISANKAAPSLVSKIMGDWQNKAFGAGQWVEIIISNVDFGEQQKILSILKKTSGVNNVKDPQYENKTMFFAVQGNMTGNDLGIKLSNIKEIKLDIESVSQNSVKAKLIK